ncbi:hypothetical protein P4O66_001874 [Electrophorus voltai]|uniref:Uncharacterized protein n=1 Tax=Electrophorus voltai TaxID=2609070 RepID=A0AAD8Z416_9TELE|nr:hypothetical protein P4O66_001874 [Electrophorus voltai]
MYPSPQNQFVIHTLIGMLQSSQFFDEYQRQDLAVMYPSKRIGAVDPGRPAKDPIRKLYGHSPQAVCNPRPKMADGDPEGKQKMRREEKASREASQHQEQAEGSGTPSSLT